MEAHQRWERICELFEAASQLPSKQQEEYVIEQCGADVELRDELIALLGHEEEARTFLASPHPGVRPLSEPTGPSLIENQLLAERFQIRRFIGRGGMGDVYEAFDLELQEPVALKTVRPELATEAIISRFKTEIQLARRITHPNVCRIYDLAKHSWSDSHETLHFLTMELLAGETLSQRLRKGPIGRPEALRYAAQIAAGLGSAHKLGIVHRDMKSSNVMLIPNGAEGPRAVITDFGLAHSLSEPVSPTAEEEERIAGTPYYMAPEQYSGGVISPATDVYAFGVVLHEMLTGQRPFGTESLTRFLENVSKPGYRPESPSVAGLDARTARVILRCLEYEPEKRYRSCQELAADLFQPPLLTPRRAIAVGVAGALIGVSGWRLARRLRSPLGTSHNADASAHYQKGRLHLRRLTTDDLKKAISYFDLAIGLDPKFALAYSGRADAFSMLTDYGGSSQKEAALEALRAARQAVALGPELAETHASLGLALSNNLPIWRSAEASFQKAIALNPDYAYAHHWYGSHQARLARTKEAIESMRRAAALDPVSLPTSAILGFTYYFDHRYQDAIDQGLRTVDLDPNFRYGYLLLTRSYTEAGRLAEALQTCETGIRLSGNAPVFASALACIRIKEGNRSKAREILSTLENRHVDEHIPALYIASLHSLLGNADAAFQWLAKGWDAWESSILLVRVYPHFDPIRSDSRYDPLLIHFQLV